MRDDNQLYNLRNNDTPLVYTRTETFRRSFFPSAIRAWNNLSQDLKNVETISLFKTKLKSNQPSKNQYYTFGTRKVNCIILSMKLHCSQLKDDLFKNNIINYRNCDCGANETAFHFFFQCPLYTNHRNQLYHKTNFVELSLDTILNGLSQSSRDKNMLIHEAVASFIINTKRFG